MRVIYKKNPPNRWRGCHSHKEQQYKRELKSSTPENWLPMLEGWSFCSWLYTLLKLPEHGFDELFLYLSDFMM